MAYPLAYPQDTDLTAHLKLIDLNVKSPVHLSKRVALAEQYSGGSVFVLGVFGALVDKFPLGAVMNKGLALRGAQQHGQRYIPMLLERIARGELDTRHPATHVMPLAQGHAGTSCSNPRRTGVSAFRPETLTATSTSRTS